MTFESPAAAFRDEYTACDATGEIAVLADFRTQLSSPPEPEAGWATRNPERAMALLFVSPRDCAMVDELMAA